MQTPPEQWLYVNLSNLEISFMEKWCKRLSFPIGIGTDKTPTPTGNYYIHAMCKDPQKAYRQDDKYPDSIYGSRSMDLSVQAFDYDTWCWRAYAIHGTDDDDKIPGKCSHGCIRMKNADIEQLYEYCSPSLFVMIVHGERGKKQL